MPAVGERADHVEGSHGPGRVILDGRRASSHIEVGTDHLVNGRSALALREFMAAEKLDPKNPRVHYALADAYLARGKTVEAERHARRALALFPDYHDARLFLTGVLLVGNRYEEVISECDRLIDDPTFSEPSQVAAYRDERFPAGQDPVALGVDPKFAIKVDLTKDQPDNQVHYSDGSVFRLGSLTKDANGKAVVELFGDLKQHDMGPGLAESIDEAGNGRAMFLTRNLWGVGSSGPYLHDGRATTLTEAILEHGGEAQSSRNQFAQRCTRSARASQCAARSPSTKPK